MQYPGMPVRQVNEDDVERFRGKGYRTLDEIEAEAAKAEAKAKAAALKAKIEAKKD